MGSSLASLFPGVDLCTLPSGVPPEGQTSNLNSPTTLLRNLTIILTTVPTVLALLFSFGRLWANFKRPSCGDYLLFLAVLIAFTQNVLLITFVKYHRHIWDVPLCWINAQLMQLSYAYETLTCLGLFLAKTATLLLFHQLFQVSRQTRLAIQGGIIFSALLYGTSIVAFSYHSVPHVGKTWDDIVVAAMLHPSRSLFAVKWGIGQATLGAALDIYIFILPLPTIVRLHLPSRKRIQLMAVFATAILGIIASLVSLAYRVESFLDNDSTWIMGVLMICCQVELAVAIIVSSMPGFASFIRTNVFQSKLVSSLRSLLGSTPHNGSRGTIQQSPNSNMHQLQAGSDPREHEKTSVYSELSEPWLVDTPFTIDVKPQPDPLQPAYDDNGAKAQSSTDVQHPSAGIPAQEGMPQRWATVSTGRLSIDSLYQQEETLIVSPA